MSNSARKKFIFLTSGIFLLVVITSYFIFSNADHDLGLDTIGLLKIHDQKLKIEEVSGGLQLPTQFTFLAKDDILVLEKNNGMVRRVINGNLLPEPILDVNVSNSGEKGMLGIAVSKKFDQTFIFLFFTEAKLIDGGEILGNMLYRYEFQDNKLINPNLLLQLPARPGPYLYGGAVTIGPDDFVYISVGDIMGSCKEEQINMSCPDTETQAQNYINGTIPDGRAGILRITQDGEVAGDQGILGDTSPLNKYYAYGIRNSFGLDFDPVTGSLWDTENGPEYGDEINLVKPGSNSGWAMVQGIWNEEGSLVRELNTSAKGLVDFRGRGHYSEPEFVWNETVGPTALKFLDSEKYGEKYKNDMFVSDSNFGRIYHFDMNQNRSELLLQGPLMDKVAESDGAIVDAVFATGFGLITDLQTSPDGYLYVLTYGSGKIFRISP